MSGNKMKIGNLNLVRVAFCTMLMLGLFVEATSAQDAREEQIDRDDLYESQIVSLTLHPARENVPALKYRLTRDRAEAVDRNAVIYLSLIHI